MFRWNRYFRYYKTIIEYIGLNSTMFRWNCAMKEINKEGTMKFKFHYVQMELIKYALNVMI